MNNNISKDKNNDDLINDFINLEKSNLKSLKDIDAEFENNITQEDSFNRKYSKNEINQFNELTNIFDEIYQEEETDFQNHEEEKIEDDQYYSLKIENGKIHLASTKNNFTVILNENNEFIDFKIHLETELKIEFEITQAYRDLNFEEMTDEQIFFIIPSSVKYKGVTYLMNEKQIVEPFFKYNFEEDKSSDNKDFYSK